jgi:predicted nucleic acid-binding protein
LGVTRTTIASSANGASSTLARESLISAFTTRGLSADLFRQVLRDRFKVPPPEIALVEDQLRARTIVARPAAPSDLAPRDPDDAWVLASALAGGAELLVTGDKDRMSVGRQVPAGDRESAGLLGPPASSRVTS